MKPSRFGHTGRIAPSEITAMQHSTSQYPCTLETTDPSPTLHHMLHEAKPEASIRTPDHRRYAIEKHSTSDDTSRLGSVLGSAVAAMEEERIPYVLIGGVASSGLGRPRATQDIDLFVKPQDAKRALQALAARGFSTEETDQRWIFKAFKEDVQVDIIFHTVGGIYLDNAMLERSVEGTFEGQQVRFVPPEDLLIIKALVYDEASPRHWYDALGILSATEIDWDYLIQRSRRARRRVLSLLVYAQSIDIEVPNRVIRALVDRIYET